jgi:2,3-bisphosphoglycerate-independent phosphoglycerate mutase
MNEPRSLEGVAISPYMLTCLKYMQEENCSLVNYYRVAVNNVLDFILINTTATDKAGNSGEILDMVKDIRRISDMLEAFNPDYKPKGVTV